MAKSESGIREALENKDQGLKTTDKGVVIPLEQREPTDPENLHLTKDQFVAKQKAKKQKRLAIAEFSKEYDEKGEEINADDLPTGELVEPKPRGRKKKEV